MKTSDLQFNIIFTPDTVEYLSPLIHSLLKWSDCRFQLVANGCNEKDRQALQLMCAENSRLDYTLVSSDKMLQHGEVLNWLLPKTESDWFCFLDSDILATGHFADKILPYLENLDLFASGHPLWYAPEDITIPKDFRRLHGIHFNTEDGRELGGTYFAIYRTSKLREVIDKTGMDFCVRRWENLSAEHQGIFREMGMEKMEYDTGLALTCLLLANNGRVKSIDMPEICHLGGVSARAGEGPAYYYRGLADQLGATVLNGLFAKPVFYLADLWYGFFKRSPGLNMRETRKLSLHERRLVQGRVRKRNATANYFNAVLREILRNKPLPKVPRLGYKVAEQRLANATRELQSVFDEQGLTGSQ